MSDVGGYTASMDAVRSIDPKLLNILTGQSFIGVVSLMAWGLGYFGQPHILVRFMATKSIKALPNACRISIMWMIFCLTGAVMVGLFGLVYFTQHPDQGAAVVQNHERVFIVLSQILFNPWVAGILLSAILAAVMSTLSCQLLVCSSTLTQDFYRSILRPGAKQRELLWFGRSMVLLVAVVAIIIAQDPNSLVLSLVSYAWAGFGAAFGPVIIMSLWWKRMTRNGALAGMVVGAATVLIWHQFAWFGLYEIVPGFLFGLVAIVVFSLIGEKPSEQMEKNFDFVVRTVRGA
jgi:sodium/proline symporter